jgi:hypothetical protein
MEAVVRNRSVGFRKVADATIACWPGVNPRTMYMYPATEACFLRMRNAWRLTQSR